MGTGMAHPRQVMRTKPTPSHIQDCFQSNQSVPNRTGDGTSWKSRNKHERKGAMIETSINPNQMCGIVNLTDSLKIISDRKKLEPAAGMPRLRVVGVLVAAYRRVQQLPQESSTGPVCLESSTGPVTPVFQSPRRVLSV